MSEELRVKSEEFMTRSNLCFAGNNWKFEEAVRDMERSIVAKEGGAK